MNFSNGCKISKKLVNDNKIYAKILSNSAI